MGNLLEVTAIDTGDPLALLDDLFNRRIESIEIRHQPEFVLMRRKPDTHKSRVIWAVHKIHGERPHFCRRRLIVTGFDPPIRAKVCWSQKRNERRPEEDFFLAITSGLSPRRFENGGGPSPGIPPGLR